MTDDVSIHSYKQHGCYVICMEMLSCLAACFLLVLLELITTLAGDCCGRVHEVWTALVIALF